MELFNSKSIEQELEKQLKSTSQKTLKILNTQIQIKDKQLEVKDAQIAKLNERLKKAQKLNKNKQILLGAEPN